MSGFTTNAKGRRTIHHTQDILPNQSVAIPNPVLFFSSKVKHLLQEKKIKRYQISLHARPLPVKRTNEFRLCTIMLQGYIQGQLLAPLQNQGQAEISPHLQNLGGCGWLIGCCSMLPLDKNYWALFVKKKKIAQKSLTTI